MKLTITTLTLFIIVSNFDFGYAQTRLQDLNFIYQDIPDNSNTYYLDEVGQWGYIENGITEKKVFVYHLLDEDSTKRGMVYRFIEDSNEDPNTWVHIFVPIKGSTNFIKQKVFEKLSAINDESILRALLWSMIMHDYEL